MASETGRVLGNYILGPLLGQGGMGAVYAAEHRFLGDRVAIKVLHAHLAAEPGAAERFVREATATRRVQHPNVVRVLDFGRAEDDGALYLVMERLSGETLAARLARSDRLDEPEVRRLGAQIADGLFAAHALGVVHRNLKPANLLVTESGTPIIVDFGIAKVLGEGATAPGALFGTFEYSAPEQLGGGVVGPHSDIYALGVVLFQLATGELPHGGSKGGAPQLFSAPRRPSELVSISPALERLILQCLEAEPARRPSSMSEVRDRLREEPRDGARATQPLSAGATLSAGTTPKVAPARRRFALVVLLAIFSCVGSALAWWQARGALSPERPHRSCRPSRRRLPLRSRSRPRPPSRLRSWSRRWWFRQLRGRARRFQ